MRTGTVIETGTVIRTGKGTERKKYCMLELKEMN